MVEIQENVSLAPLTTLKIGGAARFFARVTTEAELPIALEFAREQALKTFVIGGGSNLVVADAGFDGLALQLAIDGKIQSNEDSLKDGQKVIHLIPGGLDWDTFVRFTCERGLAGLECLAGIPGFVGGSPVQNIGAYGQEVRQSIWAVRAFDTEIKQYKNLPAEACGFAYRSSIFNSSSKGRYIISRVFFQFDRGAKPSPQYADLQKHFVDKRDPTPMEVYEAVRQIRAGKGMLIDPSTPDADSRSAGSFFKNPVVAVKVLSGIAEGMGMTAQEVPHWDAPGGVKLSAAWLIEQAGFKKGFALGRVGISSKHTLALINRTGDASCEELMRLRDLIVMTVEDRFRVGLVQEPVMLG